MDPGIIHIFFLLLLFTFSPLNIFSKLFVGNSKYRRSLPVIIYIDRNQ